MEPISFTSAREAEEWARDQGADVRLNDNAVIANIVAQGVQFLKEYALDLPMRIEVNASAFQAEKMRTAPAKTMGEVIYLNPAAPFWNGVDDEMRRIKERSFWSTGERLHVFMHEYGHVLHYRADPERYLSVEMAVDQLTLTEKRRIARNVSDYAATNQVEMVAEVFVGLFYGMQYPQSIISTYVRFGGPVR